MVFSDGKVRENALLALPSQSFSSHAANSKRNILKARLFYLGHTKFPDRMASRTAQVRNAIYKHDRVADAIQAHRFVNRLKSTIFDSHFVFLSQNRRLS